MNPDHIRESKFNGSFYPGTETEITRTLSVLKERANESGRMPHPPIIVVPHAGWVYSGLAAVRGISTLKSANIKRLVMIGPSHRHYFSGFSIAGYGGYKTPLGLMKIDIELQKEIQQATGFDFVADAHEQEHSLEVNIPMIQDILPSVEMILPILAGSVKEDDVDKLAGVLSDKLDPSKDAIMISTDLSHFYSYKEARKLDEETLKAIISGNSAKLADRGGEGGRLCCGFTGVITAIETAKRWKLGEPELLMYYNSGDSGGDKDKVVGYASLAWPPSGV